MVCYWELAYYWYVHLFIPIYNIVSRNMYRVCPLGFTVSDLRVRVILFSHGTSVLYKFFLLCFNPFLCLMFPTPQGIRVNLGECMVLSTFCDSENVLLQDH